MDRQPWWKGARGEWYVVLQFILFALIAVGPRTWPGGPSCPIAFMPYATWGGLALMIGGATLSVGGLRALGPANLTVLPYPTQTAILREAGPYSLVRHPIYSGLILGAFGWGLYQHAPLTNLFAVALFVLFDLKSQREERWLAERFDAYSSYRERVARLIPWLY